MDLDSKAARLVTGASKGIGKNTAGARARASRGDARRGGQSRGNAPPPTCKATGVRTLAPH
jgi:NAD(P)-dependent dehydrogenase (short-subunit alcohol dehydrogenase family)